MTSSKAKAGWVLGVIAWCSVRLDAADLYGIVRLRTASGPPLSGVQVTGGVAGQPDTTTSAGQFHISFPFEPGSDVTLTAGKDGYVVVSEYMLHAVLRSNPLEHPVEILMCLPGEEAALAQDYFHIKVDRAIDSTEREKLAALHAGGNETAAELKALGDQLNHVREQGEKMATQLASIKPLESSSASQRAMTALLAGHVDDALGTLDESELEGSELKLQQRHSQIARDWVLRGTLLAIRFRVDEAARAFDRAVAVDADLVDVQLARGYFYGSIRKFDQARASYDRALALARKGGQREMLAGTLNDLGLLEGEQRRTKEAREDFEQALAIWRELARTQPANQQRNIAMTLGNIGRLDQLENRFVDARKAYEEALAILRDLAARLPTVFAPEVAKTLEQLAHLDVQEGQFDRARQRLTEALAIQRGLMHPGATSLPAAPAALFADRYAADLAVTQRTGDARRLRAPTG